MIGFLGRSLVLLSLLAASAGMVLALAAGLRRNAAALAWARRLSYVFALGMLGANLAMEVALLAHDFSVQYVAQVGSRSTPTWVTIVSLWSALEGSILFWGVVLGGYVSWATWWMKDRHPEAAPWITAVLLLCGVFFAFLIAGPAHPFAVVPNPPMDGPGPNALLQNHILMVLHPPMLYLGYVGMTVPFSIACGALIAGRLGPDLLRSLRISLLFPWTFLTIGIVLGGWWAYEVLGWGGYWAWDPVENASLLPWLTATAALHSILVVERKGILKGWTLTLVLSTFLLTILGTFMTRSGVFNSVHSFTQSDIGPTFLVFLGMGLVASLVLLSTGIGRLESEGRIRDPKSREAAFLVNNLIFVMLTLTVLLGTVFPLIVEAVQGRQISVGEPYFNQMSVPLGVALLFLMGIGPALPWGRATGKQALASLLPPTAGGVLVVVLGFVFGARSPWLLLTLFAGGYALYVTFAEMLLPLLKKARAGEAGHGVRLLFGKGRRRFGSYVAHLGVVLVLVAVGVSSTGRQTLDVSLGKGESARLGPYTLTYVGSHLEREPHRVSTVALVRVEREGKSVAILEPRLNQYPSMREAVGTPAVHSTPKEDVYLSLMSLSDGGERMGMRAFRNPMVIWIWLGAGVIVLGSGLVLWPSRRSATARVPSALPRRREEEAAERRLEVGG
jgi:cytochrome c-type biogenesis protein CcmF